MADKPPKDKKRIDLGDDLNLYEDDNCVWYKDKEKKAKHNDVPKNRDMKPSHPLYDERVVRVVPSGLPDCTVTDEGELVPFTLAP